jgi:hypothetical protein
MVDWVGHNKEGEKRKRTKGKLLEECIRSQKTVLIAQHKDKIRRRKRAGRGEQKAQGKWNQQ